MKTLFEFAAAGMKAQAEVNKLCRSADPTTSHKAAEKMVESGALSRQEELVYQAIKNHLSYEDIEEFTAKELSYQGVGHLAGYYTIQRRLSGLLNKKKIERIQIGQERIGATQLFKPIYKKRDDCCVWKLT